MNAPVAASEDLIYSVEDGIARLTFNRPQARNALTFAMYEQMAAICETINNDRSIKALILTGAAMNPMGFDPTDIPAAVMRVVDRFS